MNIFYRKIILSFLAVFLSFFPREIDAIGQITDPIAIGNALRENSYSEILTVFNTENSPQLITLSAAGEVASWVSFQGEGTPAEKLSEIEVPARSQAKVLAVFTVPQGTPNGKYTGTISAGVKAGNFESASSESGSSLTQKIDREVSIEVKDREEVSFATSLIPEGYDLMQGELLKIRVIHDNRSNIDIRPQIHFQIRQGEDVLYNAIFPYPESEPAVAPNSLSEIPQLEIPTSNFPDGKYEAVFHISQGDQFAVDRNFTFSLGMVQVAAAAEPSSPRNFQLPLILLSLFLIGSAFYLLSRPQANFFRRHK